MSGRRDGAPAVETAVKECYATWAATYHDEYYGPKAAYPGVVVDLVRREIAPYRGGRLLDAGCGPASMLRELTGAGMDLYGFDLTPEMAAEGRRVFAGLGLPEDRIREGSVLDPASFDPAGFGAAGAFDVVLAVGVLPHIPAELDDAVIANLRDATAPGGLVLLQARNALFSLFTFNRYSHAFVMNELIGAERLKAAAGPEADRLDEALAGLEERFRMDLPPIRRGKLGEKGYDEVLSRTHNPLVLRRQAEAAGLRDVRVLFHHFHCLPPMAGGAAPELFRRESLAMEADPEDWRGHFMASSFIVAARRA